MEHVQKKRVVAVFDFDGTLTTKDTLFDFTQFYYGSIRFWAGTLLLSPMLAMHKIGLISAERAKQSYLSHFFANRKIEAFNKVCAEYASHIDTILNPLAIKKLNWHKEQGHTVVIDSASAENWIKPWAESRGVDIVIGTRLEVVDGFITGQFIGSNCNGQEKVSRLKEIFSNIEDYVVYAYGDSSGDKELLAIADYPFYRKFE